MTSAEVAERVVRSLRDRGVPFLVVGSFSSNQYGIPRSTQDIDLVVQADGSAMQGLSDLLGEGFVPSEQLRFETNTGTMCQEFTVTGSSMCVEIFSLSDDPHDGERFARRVKRSVFGIDVPFPTPEDVVVWKLRWGRPKDLEDVRGVILVQREEGALDWGYIRRWCSEHGTLATLDQLVEALPERGGD